MALHKRLSRKGRRDLKTDLNDYDLSFLPTPAPGPFKCEENLVEVFDLEFFDKAMLNKSRQKLEKLRLTSTQIHLRNLAIHLMMLSSVLKSRRGWWPVHVFQNATAMAIS